MNNFKYLRKMMSKEWMEKILIILRYSTMISAYNNPVLIKIYLFRMSKNKITMIYKCKLQILHRNN
jgi:hypothetical protein